VAKGGRPRNPQPAQPEPTEVQVAQARREAEARKRQATGVSQGDARKAVTGLLGEQKPISKPQQVAGGTISRPEPAPKPQPVAAAAITGTGARLEAGGYLVFTTDRGQEVRFKVERIGTPDMPAGAPPQGAWLAFDVDGKNSGTPGNDRVIEVDANGDVIARDMGAGRKAMFQQIKRNLARRH
jgi:hypothetical protein